LRYGKPFVGGVPVGRGFMCLGKASGGPGSRLQVVSGDTGGIVPWKGPLEGQGGLLRHGKPFAGGVPAAPGFMCLERAPWKVGKPSAGGFQWHRGVQKVERIIKVRPLGHGGALPPLVAT